jgi:hypothetical protein
MKKSLFFLLVTASVIFPANFTLSQNPFIMDQFTADPSARVFVERVFVYPSHDIVGGEGRGRKDWFVMEDYHVFSSANLTDWTDHGVIVSQNKVDWVDSTSYSMWAPDCIERNGKYYFYFPANRRANIGRGSAIGVAVADKPSGPFVPQPLPITNVRGIDPNVFIDKDGQAYLYWSMGNIFVARLKENMLELDSEPQVIGNLPQKGLKEGPFLFERKGIYYMTYPHVENKTERLEYAIGDNPTGPFTVTGVIMDESPTGCWTNHHSLIEFNNQWYLFYHHNDLSPEFDKNRSVRVDSLFFNEDGTIRKVTPTLRGVGLSSAVKNIEIDRYSDISPTGASIDFLDRENKFKGWKAILNEENAWIRYNTVDFGTKKLKKVLVRASSPAGGTLQIRLGNPEGKLLAEVKIPQTTDFITVESPKIKFQKGIHDLVMVLKDNNTVETDYIIFR